MNEKQHVKTRSVCKAYEFSCFKIHCVNDSTKEKIM